MPRGDAQGLHLKPLTGREVEVLALLGQGVGRRGVGERLGLSDLTIKSHLARITKKAGLQEANQMILVLWAMKQGYLVCPCKH